ncbi:DUF3696 domain-containing protein [Streptomyces sp. NPDC006365]|uniref:AAA family ATPase n=1 Tax=Streptomyces sp. NPDC006365 TaxID=3364744 RepID=UPI0036B44C5C
MIDRLTLTNFKAFQHADIPLGPLTLLTGLNSSGKSTVLQALALLRQSWTSGNIDISISGPVNRGEEAGLLLNGEFVGLGTGQDVLHEDFAGDEPRITLAVSEEPYRYEWTAGYAPEQNLLPLKLVEVPLTEEGPNAPRDETAVAPRYFTDGFQYLHADRITPTERYPRDHHMAVRRGFLGIRGEHTVNFLRHHAGDEVPEGPLRHRRAASSRLLDQVAAWMRELCPGVHIKTEVIEATDSVRLSYGFGNAPKPTQRRPTNVGFGLTYALPIVVACLSARPGSLVLLENPEAHLHPRGQTAMAQLAAASAAQGAQLVVETHSDHVLNGMRLAVKRGVLPADQAVVHYFRNDGAGAQVITPKIDADGLLDQWPEGFFDELDHTLDQLLD